MHTANHRWTPRALVAAGATLLALLGLLPLPGAPLVATAGAATREVAIEVTNNIHVELGELASRSQRKPVTISGLGPYTVSGTDSRTGQPYTFITDKAYAPTGRSAYGYESDERELSKAFTSSVEPNQSYLGRDDVLRMHSSSNCLSQNEQDGFETYCAAFGPEAWSEPFPVIDGEAVSFQWAASGDVDDYEIYAFLVEVDEDYEDELDYPAERHTLLAYGRGESQDWTTTSAAVPGAGTYRFRFVNGTYDATGLYAIGAEMYVDDTLVIGLHNPITFDGIDDVVFDADDPTISLGGSAPADGDVVFDSITPTICTVDGDELTLTGTGGICTVEASHPGGGDYVPASSVYRSFTVLEEAVAPLNNGLPSFSGDQVDGAVLTATDGSWSDGGSPITGTTYQWVADSGDGFEPIAGATSATCTLAEAPGTTIGVQVTKTNGVGSTTASSFQTLAGFTCATAPPAPAPKPPADKTPVPDTTGQLPRPKPGTSVAIVGNDDAPVTTTTGDRSVTVSGDGFELEVTSRSTSGTPSGSVTGNALVIPQGNNAAVHVAGFQPGSTVRLWLLSGPELLGEFTTDSEGALEDALATIGAETLACNHSIQAEGRLANGQQVAVTLGLWVLANPYPFPDVVTSGVHAPSIGCLEDLGIALGYGSDRYDEVDSVRRGQVASMVARALGLQPAGTAAFADSGSVHDGNIMALVQSGILQGYEDGTLRPGAPITRAQAATVLAKAAGLDLTGTSSFPDVAGSEHAGAIAVLTELGVITGTDRGTFEPNRPITRGQFATMLTRLLPFLEG